jgi:hypothetical protein
MPEIIRGYKISNNNASRLQKASVTVRTPSGLICARVHSDHGKLLQRIRNSLLEPARAELIAQMSQAGCPPEDIFAIVAKQD